MPCPFPSSSSSSSFLPALVLEHRAYAAPRSHVIFPRSLLIIASAALARLIPTSSPRLVPLNRCASSRPVRSRPRPPSLPRPPRALPRTLPPPPRPHTSRKSSSEVGRHVARSFYVFFASPFFQCPASDFFPLALSPVCGPVFSRAPPADPLAENAGVAPQRRRARRRRPQRGTEKTTFSARKSDHGQPGKKEIHAAAIARRRKREGHVGEGRRERGGGCWRMKSGRRGWERKAGSEENRLRKISAKNGAISAEDSVFFSRPSLGFSLCSLRRRANEKRERERCVRCARCVNGAAHRCRPAWSPASPSRLRAS